MGVPKFFHYMSERYPCLSELVKEYQIPEFDNLYLDMNGIIHVCSHPNDFDPMFRITEEQIFASIFHYIEILFNLIKPKKLFFMAVDGVAPRAKMNQQRGRRFRSAKEAEILEKKALAQGKELPKEARFDSNCITPGTVFMYRLHQQLKYFVTNKITNDPMWQSCKIILSGHETPGEGEHKIMDYIRYMKTLPDYDPNVRHCLYGLDADLIMLGLCSHEPHFSLLREEVKYGKQNNKRITSPEETKFFLLHLSLMREYLDLEFQDLKKSLRFEYNLENIIDDWILMGFLVGNDFIPHLPNLHINKGALPVLYRTYIEVLPRLNGYLNENGYLNLPRFQAYMERLAEIDLDKFEETYADMLYFESKTGRKPNSRNRGNEGRKKSDLLELIKATEELMYVNSDDTVSSEEDGDTLLDEFCQHKRDYYNSKLDYANITDEELKSQAEGYVRALQWNLHYYYHGCQSWSWYYPHHYSPYISDITGFKDLKLDYDMGTPFLPFQQLLAVLPAASKNLLPEAYQELMISPGSPIIDFYPEDFETDLNGKTQEWEAVVLIPFIQEDRLLEAVKACDTSLTEEERRRNAHGPMNVYSYTSKDLGYYKSFEFFPHITGNHALMEEVWRDEISVELSNLRFGLRPGILHDVYFPGFPTLKHIPYTAALKKARVKVFDNASRGESMILTIGNRDFPGISELADEYLGKVIYISWPHITEAQVVAVADEEYRYSMGNDENGSRVNREKLLNKQLQEWYGSGSTIKGFYSEKLGVEIGNTKVLVYARVLEGKRYLFSNTGKIAYEKMWSKIVQPYALQTTVKDITVHAPHMRVHSTVLDAFPVDSIVFMLSQPYYGSMGRVLDSVETLKNGRVKVAMEIVTDPVVDLETLRPKLLYMPGHVASQRIGITTHLLSRITGSILIDMTARSHAPIENTPKMNIGLNLKFNKKNEEVPGYTRKVNGQWHYSNKAVDLVSNYVERYPHILDYLSVNVKNDYFYREELFPDPDGVEKLKEVVNWLKEREYNKIERTECGTEVLDSDNISALEKIIDESSKEKTTRNMQVKPHLLYKNDLTFGSLPPVLNSSHHLLDRVVSVRSSYTVPVGLRGYIIGVHKGANPSDDQYDILFDEPFPGGLTLNSSRERSYRTSRTSFINITYGERSSQTKVNSKPTAILQPPAQSTGQYSLTASNQPRPSSAFAQWNHPQPPRDDKEERFKKMWTNMQEAKPHDETNILKQMLRIGEKPKIEEPVKTFFENIKIESSMKQPSPRKGPESYNMQLMTYFQMKNLGQPRYKFLETLDHKIVAQISVSTGNTYGGLPNEDKESACESAAYVMLGKLGVIPYNEKEYIEKDKEKSAKIILNQALLEKALLKGEEEDEGKAQNRQKRNRSHRKNDMPPPPPPQWCGPKPNPPFPPPPANFYPPFFNPVPSFPFQNNHVMSQFSAPSQNRWTDNGNPNPNRIRPKEPANRTNDNFRQQQYRRSDSTPEKRNEQRQQGNWRNEAGQSRHQNEKQRPYQETREFYGRTVYPSKNESSQEQSGSSQGSKSFSKSESVNFVPLQAIARNRNRAQCSNPNKVLEAVKLAPEVPTGHLVSTYSQEPALSSSTKPKRKPRIAANFGPAWDPNLN